MTPSCFCRISGTADFGGMCRCLKKAKKLIKNGAWPLALNAVTVYLGMVFTIAQNLHILRLSDQNFF